MACALPISYPDTAFITLKALPLSLTMRSTPAMEQLTNAYDIEQARADAEAHFWPH